jgi:hypothetical protein
MLCGNLSVKIVSIRGYSESRVFDTGNRFTFCARGSPASNGFGTSLAAQLNADVELVVNLSGSRTPCRSLVRTVQLGRQGASR